MEGGTGSKAGQQGEIKKKERAPLRRGKQMHAMITKTKETKPEWGGKKVRGGSGPKEVTITGGRRNVSKNAEKKGGSDGKNRGRGRVVTKNRKNLPLTGSEQRESRPSERMKKKNLHLEMRSPHGGGNNPGGGVPGRSGLGGTGAQGG